ncbi:MAG: hypothetical protein NZ580_08185, partial [Bacteroidia bacterium]|nr:hypothetical protein [Bacteroidia bacterium]
WLTYDASFGEIEQLITTLLGRVEVRKFWTPELLGHFGGGMVDFQLPTTGGNSLQVAFTSEVDIGGIGRAYPLFRGPVKEPLPSDFPPPAAVIASENQGNPTAENFAYGRQFRRYTVPDSLRTGLPGGLITLAYDKRSETWRFSLRGAYSRRYLSSSIQFQDGNFLEENGKWRFEPVLTTEGKQPLYHYSQGGGASFSVGWQPNPAHNLNAEGFFIANTPQRIAQEKALYINPAIDSVRHVQSYYTNFLLQRSYMGILRTSWRYSLPSGWQISTQLGWIAQHHQIPQTGAMNYVRYPNSSQIAYEQELYGESEIYAQVLTSRTQANQFYAHPFIEKRWGTTQRWVQLRLGAWASLEEQRHRSRQLGFMSDTAGGAPNVLPPSVYAHDNIRDVYNPAHIRPGGWYLIERTGDYHRHRGLTQTVAGYGWLRIGWNNRWESMIGVRYEEWRRQLFHIPIALPERETLFARLQDAHLLPIFLTKYQLSEQQSLRFGANMTLIRPPLPTQVPLPYFDYVWAFYWVGVPNLPTGRSYNADLRYEWLRSKDKLIALGLFYKQLYRLPEVYLVPASFNLTYTYSTRERRRGEVLGVELELREVLWEQENHRLWGYLNLTLSESAMEKKPWRKLGQLEGRLQGHAPIVGNAGLLYSLRGWEIAFFANYTSAQIWAIGFDPYIYPHVIEEQRWLIESQVSYRIHERWEIRLAIWDLLNMPYRRTQRLGNANSFQPDRDNLSIWERWAYRGYLTIRYLLQS